MLSKNFHPLKTKIDVYQLEKHVHVQHNVPFNVQVKTYTLQSQISLKIIWIHHRTVNQFNSIWFILLLSKNTMLCLIPAILAAGLKWPKKLAIC